MDTQLTDTSLPAVEQFCSQTFKKLLVYSYMFGRDWENAWDDAQTAFCNILANCQDLNPECDETIDELFAETRRSADRERYRKKRWRELFLPECLLYSIPDPKPGPDERVEDQELVAAIHEILDSLPDDEANLLKMYYFEGTSQEDIAKYCEINQSSASRRIEKSVMKCKAVALSLEVDPTWLRK